MITKATTKAIAIKVTTVTTIASIAIASAFDCKADKAEELTPRHLDNV